MASSTCCRNLGPSICYARGLDQSGYIFPMVRSSTNWLECLTNVLSPIGRIFSGGQKYLARSNHSLDMIVPKTLFMHELMAGQLSLTNSSGYRITTVMANTPYISWRIPPYLEQRLCLYRSCAVTISHQLCSTMGIGRPHPHVAKISLSINKTKRKVAR
jgi:hypothetical protein